jgi:pSer/pThr/pTyr-binding forkhead associated (FHA) protein
MNAERHFTIGRSEGCDIVLADDSVSRRHAELVPLGGGQLQVADCGSTHGTLLIHHGHRRPLTREVVPLDADVQFGDIRLSVSDLLDAIRLKNPDPVRPVGPPAAAEPAPARGSRLKRCACGVIRSREQRCPECGE